MRHHGVARREEVLELIGATFVLRRHPFGVAPGDQVLDLSPPALEASRAELVEASERRVELVVVEDLLVGQSALGVAPADEQMGPGLPVAVLTRTPRGHDVQSGRPRDEGLGQGQRGVRHRRRERAHAIHVRRPIPARPQPAMIDRHEVRAEVGGDRIPVACVECRHELRSASDQRRRGGRVVHDEVPLLEVVERGLLIVIAEEDRARDQTGLVELEHRQHRLLEVLPEPGGDMDEREAVPADRQRLHVGAGQAELGVDTEVGHDGVSADEIDSSDRSRVEQDGAFCQEQAELIDLTGGDERDASMTDARGQVLHDRCALVGGPIAVAQLAVASDRARVVVVVEELDPGDEAVLVDHRNGVEGPLVRVAVERGAVLVAGLQRDVARGVQRPRQVDGVGRDGDVAAVSFHPSRPILRAEPQAAVVHGDEVRVDHRLDGVEVPFGIGPVVALRRPDRGCRRSAIARKKRLFEVVECGREVVRVEQHHPAAQTGLVDLDGDEETDLVAARALEVGPVQRVTLAAHGDRRRRDPAETHLGHGPERDDVGLGTDGLRVRQPVTTVDPHEVRRQDLGHPVVVLAREELVEPRHHGGGGVLRQRAELARSGVEAHLPAVSGVGLADEPSRGIVGFVGRTLDGDRGGWRWVLPREARGAFGRVETGSISPSHGRSRGIAGRRSHAGQRRAGVGMIEQEIGARGDGHRLFGERHCGGVVAGGEHLRPSRAPGDGGLQVLAGQGFAGLGHLVGFVDAALGQQRACQQRSGLPRVGAHAQRTEPAVGRPQRSFGGHRVVGDQLDHADEQLGLHEVVLQAELDEHGAGSLEHGVGGVHATAQRFEHGLAAHRGGLHRGGG